MGVLIGTSGWQYRHWDGRFYPPGSPKAEQLAWYAERFSTVEVNNTFYRLPGEEVFRAWAEQTPADFRFVLKASRFLTHYKRLKDPEEPVARLLDRARPLGGRLAAVLLQLPPQMGRDDARLEAALAALAARCRVAVELRHDSWYVEEVRRLLARYGAALCLADRGARSLTPLWRTAEWGYLRLHGGEDRPPGCYAAATLEAWAERLAGLWGRDEEVFVFFNNDFHGCALRDARRFAGAAAGRGLVPSRVPATEEVAFVECAA